MTGTFGINPDDIITQITSAPTDAAALALLRMQSRGIVLAVADLLCVDDGASLAVMRRECVTEARAGSGGDSRHDRQHMRVRLVS